MPVTNGMIGSRRVSANETASAMSVATMKSAGADEEPPAERAERRNARASASP